MVGIVILNYNSWADTVACVDSIHEAEKKLEFRIYLVDNCSPVRPEPVSYTHLTLPTNLTV